MIAIRMRRDRRSRRIGALMALAGVGLAALAPSPGATEDAPTPGSAGIDTSLPATDSQVVINGRDEYAGLEITVNQTKDLVNQAVSITWKGAAPTTSGAARFAEHYLQIMQCWGDDDGSVAANPGPPPTQCVAGASDAVYGGRNLGVFPGGGYTLERIISRNDFANFDPTVGVMDERSKEVWMPFHAVDGTVINSHLDRSFNPSVVGGNYWLNPYFNAITTNEIAGGRTGANGQGAELMEITTGLESSGLGCGTKSQKVAGGDAKVPKCWLVVVPRGSAADENEGTPFSADKGVFTSPLAPAAWKHRIAIPLEFTPLDSSCDLAAEQRRISGNEMPVPAISSWQQELCTTPGLPPYAYGTVGDAAARQQLASSLPGGPGMVVVSRPLESDALDPSNPVLYAPLTVSSTVIGFNIERRPRAGVDPAEENLRSVRVAELNLTPRLVAKLLTQSYKHQTAIAGSDPGYDWVKGNPQQLTSDPDFLRFNPEFKLLENNGKNLGGLVMPSRDSDAAQHLWSWVFADPEARAWLEGEPDEFGMKVNPVYSSDADSNPSGSAFGNPIPEQFPKSDPYCYRAPNQGPAADIVPPPLCGTDWLPYTQSLRDSARLTRAADDGAKTFLDTLAPSSDKSWKSEGPQTIGSRSIMSLTDSASAFQYGLQTARLSRAGDDGVDRKFIAPDVGGMAAGVAAMQAAEGSTVLESVPTTDAPNAYPLTEITYAAITPLVLEAQDRADYAAFLDYAGGGGQVPGRGLGQLPPGYAPLSEQLRAETLAVAKQVRELSPPTEEAEETPNTPGPSSGDSTPLFDATSFPSSSTASLSPAAQQELAADFGSVTPVETPAASPAASKLMTPILKLAGSRFVLPALAGVALFSGLGTVEITKRPRRVPAIAGADPGGSSQPEGGAG